ncbi:MAG: TlyA family RNA methyltransferase [Culicoidibacterales bacterium]
MAKKRVDIILFEQNLFDSREAAKRAIMAGNVYEMRTQARVDKPGTAFDESMEFDIKGTQIPYVSRGGLKLKHALDFFAIDVVGEVVLDIGSSTGGFTDCLLQEGAKFVYALDVGTNQLAWKMRSHPQVKSMENTNFRYVEIGAFTADLPSFIVTDVSFISLKIILDSVEKLFGMQPFRMVALIKPQFEAGREHVRKKGIIKDPKVHQMVIESIKSHIEAKNWHIHGIESSPITGTKGNKEFLIYFENEKGDKTCLHI